MAVTPELAKEWLERNQHNRALSSQYVGRYREMMEKDEWLLAPDAIAFDLKGRLVNGQHRLHAVIEAGQKQDFVVVTGLSPRVFEVADQGRSRNLKQALQLDGFTHVTRLAAVTRQLYRFENGTLGKSPHVNTPDGLAFCKWHCPELLEAVQETQTLTDEARHIWRPSTMNFIYYVMKWRDEKKAWDFLSAVSMALGFDGKKDPRYKLYHRLNDESKKPGGRFDRKLELALSIKAANKFFEGEHVTYLRWSPGQGEDFPMPEVGDNYPFGFFDQD